MVCSDSGRMFWVNFIIGLWRALQVSQNYQWESEYPEGSVKVNDTLQLPVSATFLYQLLLIVTFLDQLLVGVTFLWTRSLKSMYDFRSQVECEAMKRQCAGLLCPERSQHINGVWCQWGHCIGWAFILPDVFLLYTGPSTLVVLKTVRMEQILIHVCSHVCFILHTYA